MLCGMCPRQWSGITWTVLKIMVYEMSDDTPTDEDMDLLQLHGGPISDECAHWSDVAEADRPKALEWLIDWKISL